VDKTTTIVEKLLHASLCRWDVQGQHWQGSLQTICVVLLPYELCNTKKLQLWHEFLSLRI